MKKIGKIDLTKPEPTPKYFIGVVVVVAMLLIGVGIAKYLMMRGKGMFENVTGKVTEVVSLPE